MTDDAAGFGTRLYAYRRSARLSQQELAARSGLSIRTVSNLERGRSRWPHPDSIRRLADALALRDEARREFIAAAGRRLAGGLTATAGRQLGHVDGGQVVPRQLPGLVRHFIGRDSELTALTGLLDQASNTSATVVISAIEGTAGVGKTALAIRWARQVAERFPDGQLYVDLRGYDPDEPVSATEALAGFLRALGVPGPDIPAETSERAARFRSLLARRRMLVVLDNARQVEQVRPLLPGSPRCVTLVTSRDALVGLVARDGAVRLDLNLLPLAEAVELLRVLIGARVDADPEAAHVLAACCARLPLALRVAAELAAARPAVQTGNRTGEADVLANLGIIDLRQGRCREATSSLRKSLDLFRETGDRSGEAQALNGLGEVLLATSEPDGARARHAAALALTSQTGDKYEQARAHHGLARCCHVAGDSGLGRHHLKQALTLYSALDAPEADQIRMELAAGNHGRDEPFAASTDRGFHP
jgi:transcriptional regulator with XRE-family HTH domain